ncbi:MAG: Ig-like domain-containing protein [Prevotella sp.]|nr:Ig-like domain-containing protein [Prevotella sp.]
MLKQLRYFFTLMLLAVAGVGFAGSITFGDLGLENGVQYTEPFDGGDFTVTFGGGGNDGKYYNTGSGIRVYGDGTMTIASNSTITSITVTFAGDAYKPASNDVVNTGSFDAATGVWTGSSNEVVFTRPNTGSGHWRVQKVEVTVEGGVTKSTANVSVEAESILIGEDADVITDGPEITLTSSDESIVSVNGVTYTGEAAGTATITATWEEDDEFYGGSKSFTITVVDPNAAQAGTEDNPYTVEQARAAIDAGTGTQGVYATGIVSKIVTAYNSQYGNISYNISDDGTTSSPQLQAYRGFNLGGEWFTSADDVKVGDIVVVYGDLTKYNSTYEFAQGNQLVSLIRTDNREPAGLSYDVANFTATIGETDEFPALNNPNDLAITYSSTNESVATVDAETGEITLVAAGQTTIKAVTEGNDTYEPGEASYLLVVKEPEIAGTDKFELVTDASTLADGDVIILAFVDEENKAWALSTTQNSNNRAANETTLNEDGTITPGSSIQQITLEDGFYFNVGNGYLYAASSSSNWLRTEAEADDNAMADIDIAEDGGATIIFQGSNTRNYLRFNPNGGNPMFSCYAENSSIQNQPRIYRKVGGETPVVLKDAELAYPVDAFTATFGEENEFPVLANPNELEVTYTSSNEEVATIDAEGNITLVGVGETTITATSEANDEYKAGEASYVLTVEEPSVPGEGVQYQLVTSTDDITSGKYLIVYIPEEEGQALAFDGSLEALDAVENTQGVTIVNDVITTDQDIYFNIDVENGKLQSASGLYIGVPSNNNALKVAVDEGTYSNSFAIAEDGSAAIEAVFDGSLMSLRFNDASNQMRFRYYKNNGQKAIYLFKAVEEVEEEIIPVTIGSTGYATLFYSDKALQIPEGVTASIVTAVDDKVIVFSEIDDIIPAGTGVVLQGEQGSYDFVVKNVNLAAPEGNLLNGSDEAAMTEGGDIYYKLTVKNGEVGFYWGAEEGGAFENGAHKAYLAIPAGSSNAKFFVIGKVEGSVVSDGAGLADGINEVQAESQKVYYNLNGVRTNTLRKGIYIVDGKKVVIK